ncbi:hypothetical protein D3C86_1826960 [compost metagenome]
MAEFHPPHQIAFGYDADKRTFAVEDRQAADRIVQHDLGGVRDAIGRTQSKDVPRHDILGLHDRLPRLSAALVIAAALPVMLSFTVRMFIEASMRTIARRSKGPTH